jgi:PEP-CTERM motif-containing protein
VVRGSFTIDSKAVDTNPGNPDFGRYLTTGNFLRMDLGTGLTLPVGSWQVSDATSSCSPNPLCVDTLNTVALSHDFPGFDIVGAIVFLSAPPASRQGDRLPQSPAELAAYTLGNFVFEGRRVNLPSVTEEMRGTLRVRDVSTDPTPEPSTLLLVGMGAAGLASRRRRARTGGN